MQEKFLRFDGVVNLRDVGGYETRDGRRVQTEQVYRSGTLGNLKDVSQLAALGIREVWDLRSAEEVAKLPDRLPDEVTYHNRPMLNPSRGFRLRALAAILLRRPDWLSKMLLEGYTQLILTENAAIVGEFFESMAINRPILVHCTAGKDRTGIFVALLLDLLGVPRETIAADYELSNTFYDHYLEGLRPELDRAFRFRVNEKHIRPLLWVEGDSLMAVFDFIDVQFGSTENYLREKAGVSAETVANLRQHLLTA